MLARIEPVSVTSAPSTPGLFSISASPASAPSRNAAVANFPARNADAATAVTDERPSAGHPVRASRMW